MLESLAGCRTMFLFAVSQNSEKNTRENVNKDCRYLVVFLISRDKNFILLLACFGLIFTSIAKLIVFLSLYRLLFPVALEQNLTLSQESLPIFYIPTLS